MINNFPKIFLYFFLVFSSNLSGQNIVLDSLFASYAQETNDSTRINLINDIAYHFHRVNLDSTAYYGNLAYKLSTEKSFKPQESRALGILAIVETYAGNHEEALEYNIKAYELAKALKNNRLITLSSNGLCVTYDRLNNNELSIFYGKIALEAARKRRDTFSMSYILGNLTEFHFEEGNLNESAKYNKEVFALAHASDDCRLYTIAYQQRGMLLFAKNQFHEAINSLDTSLEQSYKCNDEYLVSLNLYWKSKVELARNNLLVAKEYFYDSKSLLKKMGGEDFHPENLIVESDILLNIGRKEEALQRLLEGLSKAKDTKQIHNELLYLTKLSSYHKGEKDYKQAYKYAEESKILQDSISKSNKAIAMLDLERKYNLEKKDVEVQLLQEQKNKDTQIIKSRSYQIIASTLFALLIGVVALFTWLNLRKEAKYNSQLELKVDERTQELQISNQMLSQSNEELERFAYISSHDLKQPLKNIISFTKLINQEAQKIDAPKISEYSNILENCSNQLDTLVSDILDYSLVKNDYRIQDVDLNTIVDQLQSDLKETLKSKNAKIIAEPLPIIKSDRSKMYQAFKNLIENGLKYNNSEEPVVEINSEESSDNWKIQFTDNGIGIDPKHHENIFMMFKRLHNQEEYPGSGIGLSTLKTIVEKLSGRISIDSKIGNGSKFTITLPKH